MLIIKYLKIFSFNFFMNVTQALEHLAYLGFNLEYKNQLEALQVIFLKKYNLFFLIDY